MSTPERRPTQSKRGSSIDEIAAGIQAMVLAMDEGAYLGSEESLSRHFGVSAPTLRQAARLLEHQGLLSVRRGVQGGYFVERPGIETVSRSAAIYLRGNPDLMDQVPELYEALVPFIVDRILASGRLAELAQFAEPMDRLPPRAEFIDQASRFSILLRDMTDNTPLQLVLSIFFQVGLTVPHPQPIAGEEAVLAVQGVRIALAKALMDRDRDASLRLLREHLRMIHGGFGTT